MVAMRARFGGAREKKRWPRRFGLSAPLTSTAGWPGTCRPATSAPVASYRWRRAVPAPAACGQARLGWPNFVQTLSVSQDALLDYQVCIATGRVQSLGWRE